MGTPGSGADLQLVIPAALHADGSLDLDGQARLVATAAEAGASGVLVDTARDAEFDPDERARIVAASTRAGPAVLATVGPPGPEQLSAARRAADAGADGLVVTIGPAATTADALAAVADVGLPLLVHHQPASTGAVWSPAEVVGLAREAGATAVLLEAAPVPDTVAEAVAAGAAVVLGGLGGLFLLEELEAGASGTAPATALPEQLLGVLRGWRRGDRGGAAEAHTSACRYLRLEAGSTGAVVRQEAWRQRGVLGSGRVRGARPLGAATKAAITRRLQDLGTELRDPYPGA